MSEDNPMRQRVLEIVQAQGPILPTQVSTQMGINSLLAGAILSEIVDSKLIRLSAIKVGGSPLYYAPGQEESLQNYIKYLHEKEKKAFELIKEKIILIDSALEPVTRVALREIRDFAVQLKVSTDDGTQIFWKWYMLSNDDAEPRIRDLLEPPIKNEPIAQPKPVASPDEIPLLPKSAPSANLDFQQRIVQYCKNNNIEILQRFDQKKKTELELIINIPSPVGKIKFYCKAKDKKSCNEGDLSTAYVQGQSKKLPVVFISTGSLTKTATQMINNEFSTLQIVKL